MFFVIRTNPSESAIALAKALDGKKRSRTYGKVKKGDVCIGWGERVPTTTIKVLNGKPVGNKLQDIEMLEDAEVPTVMVAMGPVAGWLPRVAHHAGGKDLLMSPEHPDYYVRREEIATEYRCHSFMGRSIRGGRKVHRDGFPNPHPWIRSWEAGWRIAYDGSIRQRHRDIAHRAVRALGLDFGAVDIGERADGSVFVLEVNRAPGIEAGTIEAYARAIKEWANANQ